jgi:hypothetical protein
MARTKPASDVAFLCRALKAPSLAASIDRLGERARAEGWSHEEFLAACLEREVAARQDHGGEARIKAARFPARKTLEDFDFGFQRSIKRDVIAHLGTLDFTAEANNVVFLVHREPARRIWRSGWVSGPARPVTGSPSPPPRNGSPASVRPTPKASSTTSSPGSGASRC